MICPSSTQILGSHFSVHFPHQTQPRNHLYSLLFPPHLEMIKCPDLACPAFAVPQRTHCTQWSFFCESWPYLSWTRTPSACLQFCRVQNRCFDFRRPNLSIKYFYSFSIPSLVWGLGTVLYLYLCKGTQTVRWRKASLKCSFLIDESVVVKNYCFLVHGCHLLF